MKRKTENGNRDARRNRRRAGFTLVEMLVVIVIILVLMGVVFRMTRPAASKQAEAQTVAKLERLKAAIEEYYAEYGQYPPVPYYKNSGIVDNTVPKDALVQPLSYEFPWADGMRSDMIGKFSDQSWDSGLIYTFGLMSFLMPRYAERSGTGHKTLRSYGQWTRYNTQEEDRPRDVRACERWAPFLEGILEEGGFCYRERFIGGDAYTNRATTVEDGWERELVYVSPPPHQSYLLFSKGPDGKYDYNNPGSRDSKDNKDNIYGDVGFVLR
jgi:prepilin-type N-terminal cleavage/methylation domain-containing protein